MTHMTLGDFEARYRADPDPWGYEHSSYEQTKYAATLQACGPGPFHCALELGGSIGVFTGQLAPRCRRLVSVDAAPTAVAAARARLAGTEQVQIVLGAIPEAIPEKSFDLVVASEILYYLDPQRLAATLAALQSRMVPGARLVAVHWRPAGSERPFTAGEIRAVLIGLGWLERVSSRDDEHYLLDTFIRR